MTQSMHTWLLSRPRSSYSATLLQHHGMLIRKNQTPTRSVLAPLKPQHISSLNARHTKERQQSTSDKWRERWYKLEYHCQISRYHCNSLEPPADYKMWRDDSATAYTMSEQPCWPRERNNNINKEITSHFETCISEQSSVYTNNVPQTEDTEEVLNTDENEGQLIGN